MIDKREDLLACIDAEEVILGENVVFGDDVRISAIGGSAKRVVIGDNTFLNHGVTILVPEFEIGDYGTVHRNCFMQGYKPLTIGHNFWAGHGGLYNSTDRFSIGNNVGVGAYAQFFTHIRFGDTLIGARFEADKPMVIHDDTWFVGTTLVSPITAGPRSMAMLGAVITRDMEPNRIYAGVPAKDVTDKLGGPPFRDTTIDERHAELSRRVSQFFDEHPDFDRDQIKVVDSWNSEAPDGVSAFNVADRTYSKRRSEVEIALMRHLLPTAKFTPRANPA
jgi:acetyltransferase-like isoleucine patch superfamily enzyme